jgi:hypothetical protein
MAPPVIRPACSPQRLGSHVLMHRWKSPIRSLDRFRSLAACEAETGVARRGIREGRTHHEGQR